MANLRDLLASVIGTVDARLAGEAAVHFRFGDIPVAVRFDRSPRIPELQRMMEARRSGPDRDAWLIDVAGGTLDGRHDRFLPSTADRNQRILGSNDAFYYLWLDEAGGYVTAIDRPQRRGIVWFPTPEAIASWHVARPLLHAIKGISRATPWTPIHAASVALNGHAILATGQSGAGKTSIALACALAGWDYLGDDAVIVRPGPPAVAALYSSSRLRTDMFGLLEGALRASLGTSDDAGELKAEIDMTLLGRCTVGSAALAAIVVPRRIGGGRTTLAPIGRSETLRIMMNAAHQSILGDEQTAFEKLAAIVRDVPCYAFDSGPDPLAVPEALARLVEGRRSP
jgi:hypothetical protein